MEVHQHVAGNRNSIDGSSTSFDVNEVCGSAASTAVSTTFGGPNSPAVFSELPSRVIDNSGTSSVSSSNCASVNSSSSGSGNRSSSTVCDTGELETVHKVTQRNALEANTVGHISSNNADKFDVCNGGCSSIDVLIASDPAGRSDGGVVMMSAGQASEKYSQDNLDEKKISQCSNSGKEAAAAVTHAATAAVAAAGIAVAEKSVSAAAEENSDGGGRAIPREKRPWRSVLGSEDLFTERDEKVLKMLAEREPAIPDEICRHYLHRIGCATTDRTVARLISLAVQLQLEQVIEDAKLFAFCTRKVAPAGGGTPATFLPFWLHHQQNSVKASGEAGSLILGKTPADVRDLDLPSLCAAFQKHDDKFCGVSLDNFLDMSPFFLQATATAGNPDPPTATAEEGQSIQAGFPYSQSAVAPSLLLPAGEKVETDLLSSQSRVATSTLLTAASPSASPVDAGPAALTTDASASTVNANAAAAAALRFSTGAANVHSGAPASQFEATSSDGPISHAALTVHHSAAAAALPAAIPAAVGLAGAAVEGGTSLADVHKVTASVAAPNYLAADAAGLANTCAIGAAAPGAEVVRQG